MDKMKLDQLLGDTLKSAAEGISAPENMKVSVKVRMNENKGKRMRWSGLKKGMVATVAALALVVTGALASGQVAQIFSSSDARESWSLEKTMDKMNQEFTGGKLLEEFENGFVFEKGNHVNSEIKDETGNTLEAYTEIHAQYTADDKTVNLGIKDETYDLKDKNVLKPSEVKTVNGIEISYIEYQHLFVPGGYTLTEEEQQKVDNNELGLGYGDKDTKKEIINYEFVKWTQDGVSYSIMAEEMNIGSEVLFAMAEELISA